MKYWHNHFYSPCCKQLFRVRRVEINRWSISQSVWPPPQAPAKMACAALCQIFIPLHQADFTMSQQLLQPAAIYKHYFIKFSSLNAKNYTPPWTCDNNWLVVQSWKSTLSQHFSHIDILPTYLPLWARCDEWSAVLWCAYIFPTYCWTFWSLCPRLYG